jgi:gluconate:H+ symporter, GntP family
MSPLILILLAIVVVVILIARFKINTFLVLLAMSIVLGLSAGFSPDDAIKTIKAGFGHTLEKIGLLIIFGVILGEILDRTHATRSIANYILSKLGQNRTDLAMLSIGFLVGLPIFCDSGFIILSGLLFYLRSKNNFLTLALCLAGGLYSVHCLVPPHPGSTAATSQLSLDLGKTMIYGIIFAIPATAVAFFWSRWAGNKFGAAFKPLVTVQQNQENLTLPPISRSFLPIWLPIGLMALKAVWPFVTDKTSVFVSFIGEPVVALMIGVIAALPLLLTEKIKKINDVCEAAFGKSGHILAIVAAGGMFGEVVKKIMSAILH